MLWLFVVAFTIFMVNQSHSSLHERLEASIEFENEILPRNSGRPVAVSTSLFIVSMDNLDLTTMDFQVDFYLNHEWADNKLVHFRENDIVLDDKLHRRIWVPDTYIVNSKQSYFHNVALSNKKVQISKYGIVKFKVRLTSRVSCPVDLRHFPWDVQHCSLVLESYAYSNRDVEYLWDSDLKAKKSIFASNVKDMSQYEVGTVDLRTKVSEYAIGNWSTLEVTFELKRYSGLYVILVMGPSLIIVSISWMTFQIGHDQHPARISLGITSILTMEAIHLFIKSSLPKVNYLTTLDVYIFVSYTFVVMSMMEYALILVIVERSAKTNSLREPILDKCPDAQILQQADRKRTTEASQSLPVEGLANKEQPKKCCLHKSSIKSAHKIDSFSKTAFPIIFLIFNSGFLIYVLSITM